MDPSIRFEPYGSARASAVADMWRESRSAWPPGFHGASEFTAEGVEAEERTSGSLFTILAMDGDRVAGFCRTTPWGGEPDAAYVALINVVPDLHGRKIGRNLLLDAVRRAADRGLRRIDLNTWPANIKAVPLYKKTGFFWVPETQVSMQNHMPFLLGRPELGQFLEGEDWYACLERELSLEPDVERTPSGREVFTYRFRRDDRTFTAEFDRLGRMLSALRVDGFELGVERDAGEVVTGRPVRLTFSGSSLPPVFDLRTDPSLEAAGRLEAAAGSAGCSVRCLPVDSPPPERDRMPRVLARIPVPGGNPLELGLGLRARDPVMLSGLPVRWAPPGTDAVDLDLLCPLDLPEATVSAGLDGASFHRETHRLGGAKLQRLRIPLPPLEEGVHLLSLRFSAGEAAGAEEHLVLVCGRGTPEPVWRLTRRFAVAVSGRTALAVSRRGLDAVLACPDREGRPRRTAWLQVQAGPPFWNSDLPHQVYRLSVEAGTLRAEASWPSRPGLVHEARFRLDRAGYLETSGRIRNEGDAPRPVTLSCSWTGSGAFGAGRILYPLPEGLLDAPWVYNQVPDEEEDLPRSASDLGAPWLGMAEAGGAVMLHFAGWSGLRYDLPRTGDLTVPPGGAVEIPPLRLLRLPGGREDLLGAAGLLGWRTGPQEPLLGFPLHDLVPVMARGAEITLSHPLRGRREGSIALDGRELASGRIRFDQGLTACAEGIGTRRVALTVAGRTTELPVRLVEREPPPETSRDGAELLLRNDRLAARISIGGGGHVHSLRLDDAEMLLASFPGPTCFEWESPWFGGIHPRLCDDRNDPFRLDLQEPEVEVLAREVSGLPLRGWRLRWIADHRRWGSWRLVWTVGLLPGVPVLRTAFRLEPMAGSRFQAEAELRGFLAPGGGTEGAVLTCEADRALRQGRGHAGAWGAAGRWARVTSGGEDGPFVEAFPGREGCLLYEDYAGSGCHLTLTAPAGVPETLRVDWLAGRTEEDRRLAEIFRSHADPYGRCPGHGAAPS